MAGKVGNDDDVIADINVTPLVDIMLVLLIIFMLTNEEVTEKMKKPVIEVDLPKAASAQKEPQKPLSIVITKDNALFVVLLGAAAGMTAALLLAPRSGKETRRRLGRWMEDIEEKGGELFGEGRELWEEGKKVVQDKAEKLRDAVQNAAHKVTGH